MEHSKGEVYRDKSFSVSYVVRSEENDRAIAEFILSDWGEETRNANAERFVALWNADPDMPTAEAVKYIKHGREMEEHFRTVTFLARLKYGNLDAGAWQEIQACEALLTKLNKEGA